MKKSIRRQTILLLCLAMVLTSAQCMGFHISMKYQTSVHTTEFFQMIHKLPPFLLFCIGLLEFAAFYILLRMLFSILERRASAASTVVFNAVIPRWSWITVGGALFLCWLPCLAASFPGFFNYDVSGQLPQAMYPEAPYNTHHPLLHTLVMGKVITLGYRLSGETDLAVGILLHSLLQMAFCAAVFTCALHFTLRITGNKWLLLVSVLYYAFFPVIAMFSMSTTKDVPCYAVLILCIIQLYNLFEKPDRFFSSPKSCVGLILCLVLLCLFRKNSIYAVVLLILAVLLRFRNYRRRSAVLFGIFMAAYVVCDRGMIIALHAEAGSMSEAFSLPYQQIARTWCIHGEDGFEAEELEALNQVADSTVWESYNPFSSDSVKGFVNFSPIAENPGRYLRLWLSVGLRYPREYLMAFLENTYQAWYPGTSIITEPGNSESYYFDYDMSLNLERPSKNKVLARFYEKISKAYYYQKVPFIRLLFSVGAMLWLALITFCYGLWRQDRSTIYPMMLILAFCLTNLLGPVVLVRYYLMLFYAFPIFLGYLFKTAPTPSQPPAPRRA